MRNTLAAIVTATALTLPTDALATIISAFLFESGSDVVMEYSGTIDTTGFTPTSSSSVITGLDLGPANGLYSSIISGFQRFSVTVSGPDFGTGGQILQVDQPASGDSFGFFVEESEVLMPFGYVSGSPIAGMSIIESASLSELGAVTGVYTYETIVSGVATNTITLTVESPTTVPLPATLPLFATGLCGIALWRRRRSD